MERFKTDSRTGLRYELQGDYYVVAGDDETERTPIGPWGRRHLRWLKENRRVTYMSLLTSGKLHEYLRQIDSQANVQYETLIRQMASAEGLSEQMKAENQMMWVQKMNNIRSRAEEIIRDALILTAF